MAGTTQDFYPDGVTNANSAVRVHSYSINNNAQNRPPVAGSQSLQTPADTALEVSLTGSDPENASVTFEITSQPTNGSLSGTAPALTYTLASGYVGADSFKYRVNDGKLNSTIATISIAVQSPNQPPASFELSNPGAAINVDGNTSDWSGLNQYVEDTIEAGDIDLRQVWMADDAQNIYIAWQQSANIGTLTWGHQIYLDTDAQAGSGFRGFNNELSVGAEYVIERNDLFRYTGTGNDWGWEYMGTLDNAVAGNSVEYRIPKALLQNPVSVDFFLYGNDAAVNGNGTDYYPNAVTDPAEALSLRQFRYNIQ